MSEMAIYRQLTGLCTLARGFRLNGDEAGEEAFVVRCRRNTIRIAQTDVECESRFLPQFTGPGIAVPIDPKI